MTLIHSDGKSILLRSINIWLASYWQLTPIKRALGHSLDIMGSASNYVHFSFFHIWLASVEFRREKSCTWHVASNFTMISLKFPNTLNVGPARLNDCGYQIIVSSPFVLNNRIFWRFVVIHNITLQSPIIRILSDGKRGCRFSFSARYRQWLLVFSNLGLL